MTEATSSRFHYVYTCDLNVNLQLKIGTLEGKKERPSYKSLIDDPLLRFSGSCQETCSDLYVSCQLFADNHPLALPIRTSYKSFSTRWNWNEWLTLPVKFSDLPRNAHLALTVWDIYGPRGVKPVGGTTISVFSKYGTLRQGMHDLKVWPYVEADGMSPTTTAGKSSGKQDEMSRLGKLSRKHRNGHMVKVDWLDRLTFREIEMIAEKQKRDSNFMYLMIEFPHIHFEGIEYAVVYFEMGGDDVFHIRAQAEIVTVPDPEIQLENLVEHKHHRLARSLRSGPTDRDLKPNASTRDQLNVIVGYPPTKPLTSEEKDLVWKFRFYLSSQKKALAKFLKSVSWSVPQEVKQALDLLAKWSPMDVEDALELLSPNPAFTHRDVRRYAVTRLQQADDEELKLYLLQLVQALKYEDFEEIQTAHKQECEQTVSSTTTQPTTPRKEPLTPTEETPHSRPSSLSGLPQGEMSVSPETLLDALGLDPSTVEEEETPTMTGSFFPEQMDLATFLITRAWHCKNFSLANYLFWYLKVECDDQDSQLQRKDSGIRDMYITMLKRFSNYALRQPGVDFRLRRAAIASQQLFMDKIVWLVKLVARESGNRKKKIEKLQSQLRDPEYSFTSFDPFYLPLDPDVLIKGIVADKATLFKSALMPCRFNFETTDGREYVTIFKHGDDLRQDQLILQIITLMDKLLRKENLDLKLTPYKVLATSSRNGFVQFIDSIPVAEVMEKHDSILNYLRKVAPAENTPLGVTPEVIDNYVKSCAGYSVVTYLLGVGDRHLDNLLLADNGRLFHIDFGYILGRDPKPMPPPMKLSKEIVEAMGGTGSEYFADFKQLCYTAFLHLRRSSNLFLNLFSLMVDANIPDIALEPDKTVKKMQDKFRLDLTDEEAVQYMQSLIDASVTATVAAFMEQMHKLAQYWRK